ncbi:MAG: hypothetical protein UT66_C0005G0020 [candidate division CPR2 bacterium GW2011_GWC1_39_9]|uniref:DUF2229 domain-containing protein n=1 Tax=candidate division CPR2 bacterium GW2011_GWC2_39_10 TaxID=1618345 RepID=A0A0G0Q066_UNCC2|nr:MAG: hypothetical protein UT18_C0004G0033 [candidate division CPR2 bacterium GW2011_GWC2_39_10]KKR35984.1 MAG: hypothetical protein UT66_C0005G0020 [candidate division CPR2 bacterium GW2011_GWC1_39_9]
MKGKNHVVTVPQMGTMSILVEDWMKRLGIDFLPPSPLNNKMIEVGASVSPEFACFPLKATIASIMNSADNGADIALMVGGYGPCRFGYYGEVYKAILKENGYDKKIRICTLEPMTSGEGLLNDLQKFFGPLIELSSKSKPTIYWHLTRSFKKAVCMDKIESMLLSIRAKEKYRGDTQKKYDEAVGLLRSAKNDKELAKYQEEAVDVMNSVELDSNRKTFKIGVVGEFYVVLEPFINMNIERLLNELGIEIERAIYITDWTGPKNAEKVAGINNFDAHKLAKPWIDGWCGGDCTANVGHAIHYINEGIDGIIHLYPFGCMPDIMALEALEIITAEAQTPFLSIQIDEKTGQAGIVTRLQAFTNIVRKETEKIWHAI